MFSLSISVRITCAFVVLGITGAVIAAGPAIGIAKATGNFRMDHAAVIGNGTVQDGALIETSKATPDVVLNNGVRMRLASDSRGKVFQDRLVLEKGATQIRNANRYNIEASKLRLIPVSQGASATVAVNRENRVEIAALTGAFRVETANGLAVANMSAGMALGFDTQEAGARAPMSLCGKVEKKGGKLMLTDTTAKITVELQGTELEKYVGKNIAVTGNPTGGAAVQTLQVMNVKEDACSNKAAAAAGGAAAGAGAAGAAGAGAGAAGAAGAAAAGIGVGTQIAIAGVIVGAAVGTGTAFVVADDEKTSSEP